MFRPDYDPDNFFHWHNVKVRFRDLDPLNHVNNAVFNTFFEEARIKFVSDVKEWETAMNDHKSFVLVKSTIEYLKQISYPSTLLIGSGVGEIGNTSIEALQAIYDADSKDLLATGISKGVWYDLKKQRPAKLPLVDNMDELKVIING